MKTFLAAWAYALAMALAVMLGLPSVAVAGGHKSADCYTHRALMICKHNDGWSKATLKRTYAVAKLKKKGWGHHRSRHHAKHWRKHDRKHHMRHHHRKHHARHHHRKHHPSHVDLVTRQQSLAVGPCETSLPKLPNSDYCVHGVIIYPPVVERVTDPVPHSERGNTRRYYPRGYYDPNAWRYRPADTQIIRALHKEHGLNH